MTLITHEFDKLMIDIQNLKKNFRNNVPKVLRKAALNVGGSIIMNTPHDTGRARGNWQTSLDTPILSEIDRLDYNGQQAINELGTVTRSVSFDTKVIHFSNNLPYINRLNSGWSKQADPGYVERAVEGGILQISDDYLLKDNGND